MGPGMMPGPMGSMGDAMKPKNTYAVVWAHCCPGDERPVAYLMGLYTSKREAVRGRTMLVRGADLDANDFAVIAVQADEWSRSLS